MYFIHYTTQSENQYLIHELNGMKKRLLSFEEFAKDAQPEALFTLVHSIVDRIYITTDGTKQKCQVYIKGCATEDYSDVLGAAGYIIPPHLSVASFMGYLKSKSSLMIFDKHANLKYKYGNRHFWCRGYYVDTVGKYEGAIRDYIRNQLQDDIANDQLSLKEFVDPFTGEKAKKA